MANTMRWRYGDTSPVILPVDAATVIEIGDLLWLDSDKAKPASAMTDQLSELANQQEFHDMFAGVAMQASRDGDTDSVRVVMLNHASHAVGLRVDAVGELLLPGADAVAPPHRDRDAGERLGHGGIRALRPGPLLGGDGGVGAGGLGGSGLGRRRGEGDRRAGVSGRRTGHGRGRARGR